MVAHNAAFDVDMLKKAGIEPQSAICTLKPARYFDKEGAIPKYGSQYLRYYLKLQVDAIPHTALIEVSNKPVLYRRMPFGKHKGLKMEEVPVDYLQWLAGIDLEEDLRYTIEQYLGAWG